MHIVRVIRRNIKRHSMFAPGQTVVVAVSGGPDSLCLLHALVRLRAELDIALHVAHLDHGLRGEESAADAAFVRETCVAWGVPATIARADVQGFRHEHKLTLEEAARRVRHAFLQRLAAQTGAAAIALAHTADDQVETILMRLLRGAGLTGLRGMSPVQPWPGGAPLLRPLLDVRRADVEAYCRQHGLEPRRDHSNEDLRFWRNRLRRQVLPNLEAASPGLRGTLLRTARLVADEDAYLGRQAWTAGKGLVTLHNDWLDVDTAGWLALPIVLQRRLLRDLWRRLAGGSAGDLGWRHVEQALAVIGAHVGKQMLLPHGVRLQRRYDRFTLHAGEGAGESARDDLPMLNVEALAVAVPGVTELPGTPWLLRATLLTAGAAAAAARPALGEDFDAAVVGQELIVRRRRPGERIQPLGMSGRRKVHDIMIDGKIERAQRARLPLVLAGETVLWVAGCGRSDYGKLTPATTLVLRLCFERRGAGDGRTDPYGGTADRDG